jgi:hypothetical protein
MVFQLGNLQHNCSSAEEGRAGLVTDPFHASTIAQLGFSHLLLLFGKWSKVPSQ